jgi:hypothetical protein
VMLANRAMCKHGIVILNRINQIISEETFHRLTYFFQSKAKSNHHQS